MTFPLPSRQTRAFAALLLGGFVLSVAAREPLPADASPVDAKAIDYRQVLKAPPAEGSPEAEADLQAVLQMQAWRTPEMVAWAKWVDRDDLFAFADAIGTDFTPARLPKTATFLKWIDDSTYDAVGEAKNAFGRPRPFVNHPEVHPCVELRREASYPSGHAVGFFVEAEVLSDLFPQRREALFTLAQKLSWGRVIGGVHYPSDLVGGHRLAEALFAQIKRSPAYQSGLAEARSECAAAGVGR